VNPAEVVVHEVQRNGVLVIRHLLAKPVGQSGKPAHRHSHREVPPESRRSRYSRRIAKHTQRLEEARFPDARQAQFLHHSIQR